MTKSRGTGMDGAGFDLTTIGPRIRRARLLAGMSQDDLARKADTSGGHMSQVERGLSMPRIKTLARIAAALNTPLAYLLNSVIEGEE